MTRFLAIAAAVFLSATAAAAAQNIMMPVMLNGAEIIRLAITASADGGMRIDKTGLVPFVHDNLDDEAGRRFDALPKNIAPEDVAAAGFRLDYDAGDGVLRLIPDPAHLKVQNLSTRVPALGAGDALVTPAATSAFVNMRAGQEFMEQGTATGRQPLRLDVDGAINHKGWVIESRADYLEDDNHPVARRETRLVHDWPDKMVRAAAGDLSYPVTGFQSYQPMAGVSVARNFSLQPYRVTTPAGDSNFILRNPARVDVIVNGQRIRTLQLPAGSYNISDFPVTDGGNDITLEITDAAGNVERRSFPLVTDQKLLQKGLHEFSYNAGIESETVGREINYSSGKAAVSAFHRYGVTETLTVGAALQGDADVQQAGLSVLKAFDSGTVGIDGAASHASGGNGGAVQATFRRSNFSAQRDFSWLAAYRTADFSSLGERFTVTPGLQANPQRFETAARYNFMLPSSITAGIGARYRGMRGGMADDWSLSGTLSKTLTPAITLSASAEQSHVRGAGVFVNMIWSPPAGRHSVSGSIDTMAGTQRTEWNYRSNRDVRSFNADVGVTRTNGEGLRETGGIGYTGYRGEFTARHDMAETPGGADDWRTSVTAGSAVVFADGHVALSRPVNGSFVVLPREENLGGRAVGINPASSDTRDDFQALADNLGPAVIADATPYMYRPLRIDTHNLSPQYDIGRDVYTVLPSYKSGAVLMVGNPANMSMDGTILHEDGTPAALEGGVITKDTGETQEFFTNKQGRFRISRLLPGKYTMTLNRYPVETLAVTIPESSDGKFVAGALSLEGS